MKFERMSPKLVDYMKFERWRRERLVEQEFGSTPNEASPDDQQMAPPAPPEAQGADPQAQPGEEPASTPEAQAPEPDDKTLAITVHVSDGVSDEFRIAAKNALLPIPPEIRKIVSDFGFSITLAASMSELETELDEPSHVPLDRLSSIMLRDSKEIAIAESIKAEDGTDLPTLNPAGVLRHAFGHAVDELGSQFIKGRDANRFSDLESFEYAHVSDIGRLAQDKKAKLAFYVEDQDAARSEVFAECFAAMHEGGSTYTIEVMSQFFPAVMKQVKDTITAVKNKTMMTDKDGDGVPDETQPKDQAKPQKPEKPAPKAPEPQQTAPRPPALPKPEEPAPKPQDALEQPPSAEGPEELSPEDMAHLDLPTEKEPAKKPAKAAKPEGESDELTPEDEQFLDLPKGKR